ncbi:MAG: membrane-bound O-acyltransferase family protein [Deltaproteobacteria bacterium]|nr:MAG: membrane-bound O-acyltransferase family protein [Deltaproteobacteria bacterium]
MLFNSFEFLVFFIAVILVSLLLREKGEWRVFFLFIASCYFYMCWNWKFLFLILFSICLDYTVGWRIYISESITVRKRWLAVSLTGNIGCLAVFKYYNFFAENIASFFSGIGLTLPLPHWNIILPVGISFYTFQTLSYTFDIYRGELRPKKNFLHFATYVAFFPQLVAGPIVRARDFLPQLEKVWRFSDKEAMSGAAQIIQGLFKKVLIGDALAAALVDQAYSYPGSFSGVTLLLATYGYAMQIYCDFSGYSDIAIGCARVLGFRLPVNFNRPYMATSVTDFWRRWHISLSTWLRDYLYISMGGNRKGRVRTYINLMVTMLLGGLWHGAAWNFVLWGGAHGFFLVAERFLGRWINLKKVGNSHMAILARRLLTFHIVLLGWVLFRAKDLQTVKVVLWRIITFAEGLDGVGVHFLLPLLVGYFLHLSPLSLKDLISKRFVEANGFLQGALISLFIFAVMLIMGDNAPFIYFQF